MKKYLGILGALALTACGSNGGPLNLGTLTTALFDDADMTDAAIAACPAAVAQVDTVTVTTGVNSTDYTVTINGTAYTITSDASATTTEVSAALVACINGGGASCKNSLPAAGNADVTAADTTDDFTLTADVAGTPFTATEADANLTLAATTANAAAGCNGVLEDTYGADEDTTALIDFLFTAGTSPSETDMIACAKGTVPATWGALGTDLDCNNFTLDVPTGQTQAVSLSATQKVNCNGATAVDGTITVVDTISATLTDAEVVVATTVAGSTSTQTITAVNCKITGNVLNSGGGGVAETTIVLNGSVTSVDHSGKMPLAAADPDTFRVTGNFTVTTDLDGAGAGATTFWTDQINLNASEFDNGTVSVVEGGICLGSAVSFAGARVPAVGATDADDACATVTDQFVPSSDLP